MYIHLQFFISLPLPACLPACLPAYLTIDSASIEPASSPLRSSDVSPVASTIGPTSPMGELRPKGYGLRLAYGFFASEALWEYLYCNNSK